MGHIKSFEDLNVWQASRELGVLVYKITKSFPKDETYGIASQMRRAVISVSSNIAEGFGRYQKKDKEHFYVMALGSLSEVLSQAIISNDLGYVSDAELKVVRGKIVATRKQLISMVNSHRS